jgi:N-acylneuraminate cytidylyltransferase
VWNAVALVPARSGSQRVPGKNLRQLAGHPLIAYAIAGALESDVFDAVIVSTDSEDIAAAARRYGAEVPGLRPSELATGTSADVEWVMQVMAPRSEELFAILRPTSPFRRGSTIRRALTELLALGDRADSIRAVELCRQHPAKMWVLGPELMEPLLPQPEHETPLHSRQYQALPPVYVQNSSLEIAWSRVLRDDRSIAGRRVAPFLTTGTEGLTIDYPDDLARAESLLLHGNAELPPILGSFT